MNVRRAVIAGSWYPGDPDELRATIESYIEQASLPEIQQKPLVLIAPHAGYVYSGPVAAYAYKSLLGHDYTRVVVVSPSHRASFPFISIWPEGAYETPLGQIDIDAEACDKLQQASSLIRAETLPHSQEHSLEIQLPFLQHVLGEFKLVPLIMGSQEFENCRELARALAEIIDDPADTLVVASSDLSHFHHSSQAEMMDGTVRQLIEAYDVDRLAKELECRHVEACGGGPILSAMLYSKAKGHSDVSVLNCANSGDITGDNTSVVGYLAAVIC